MSRSAASQSIGGEPGSSPPSREEESMKARLFVMAVSASALIASAALAGFGKMH